MDQDTIRARVKEIVAKVTGLAAAEIPDHAALREDLQLDSLTLLEIGVNVDYEFRLSLPDLDQRLPQVRTIDDAVALVEEILAGRLGAAAEDSAVRG
jgi:acyl carrier protein